MLSEDLLSGAGAAIGMASLAAWPLARSRRAMLLAQLGVPAGYGFHFAVEDLATAAAVNALGALQILLLLAATGRTAVLVGGNALAAAMGAACLVTYDGPHSVLAAAAMTLVAVGRTRTDPIRLRQFALAAAPLWLAHNLWVGSPLAIADAASIAVGAYGLARASASRPAALAGSVLKRNGHVAATNSGLQISS